VVANVQPLLAVSRNSQGVGDLPGVEALRRASTLAPIIHGTNI
jgi:hypothetical protein